MDHAWIMTHEKELGDISLAGLYKLQKEGRTEELQEALAKDAFRSYAMAFPHSGIFLVDTYNPEQGLENAITVMKEMIALGHGGNYGVRFDSGDITEYSKLAQRRYTEEGLDKAFCAAADGIDEYSAKEMRADGAFYHAWGVGTGGSHVPPLGLVYKASAVLMDVLHGEEPGKKTPVMKVASNAPFKSSNPGKINSRRYYDAKGQLSHVVVYDEDLGLDPAGRQVNLRNFDECRVQKSGARSSDLLVPVFDAGGNYVYPEPAQKESFGGSDHLVTDLAAIDAKMRKILLTLPENVRRIERPRDEILKKTLLQAFTEARKAGKGSLNLDIAVIEAALPPEVQHIPVYLDQKLFEQRRACEIKHLGHANKTGVAEYKERFEENTVKKTKRNPKP
jgi:hypothetical protein